MNRSKSIEADLPESDSISRDKTEIKRRPWVTYAALGIELTLTVLLAYIAYHASQSLLAVNSSRSFSTREWQEITTRRFVFWSSLGFAYATSTYLINISLVRHFGRGRNISVYVSVLFGLAIAVTTAIGLREMLDTYSRG